MQSVGSLGDRRRGAVLSKTRVWATERGGYSANKLQDFKNRISEVLERIPEHERPTPTDMHEWLFQKLKLVRVRGPERRYGASGDRIVVVLVLVVVVLGFLLRSTHYNRTRQP